MAFRVAIELPGPVRGKGRARTSRFGGRPYTDDKTRTYEARITLAAQHAMGDAQPFAGACALIAEARFAVPASWSGKRRAAALSGAVRPTMRPDADNIIKVADGLNGVVFLDDKQIVQVSLRKVYSDYAGLTMIVEALADG